MRHDGGDTWKSQDYHAGLRVLPLKAMECEKKQMVLEAGDEGLTAAELFYSLAA